MFPALSVFCAPRCAGIEWRNRGRCAVSTTARPCKPAGRSASKRTSPAGSTIRGCRLMDRAAMHRFRAALRLTDVGRSACVLMGPLGCEEAEEQACAAISVRFSQHSSDSGPENRRSVERASARLNASEGGRIGDGFPTPCRAERQRFAVSCRFFGQRTRRQTAVHAGRDGSVTWKTDTFACKNPLDADVAFL